MGRQREGEREKKGERTRERDGQRAKEKDREREREREHTLCDCTDRTHICRWFQSQTQSSRIVLKPFSGLW